MRFGQQRDVVVVFWAWVILPSTYSSLEPQNLTCCSLPQLPQPLTGRGFVSRSEDLASNWQRTASSDYTEDTTLLIYKYIIFGLDLRYQQSKRQGNDPCRPALVIIIHIWCLFWRRHVTAAKRCSYRSVHISLFGRGGHKSAKVLAL